MSTWPRTLTEDEQAAILSDQIERFASEGWRLLHRTPTTAQMTRPKRLSVGAAVFWLLCFVVGLLVYLLIYAGRRDPVVRLSVTEDGEVVGDFVAGDDEWPQLPGDWQCPVCGYTVMMNHLGCPRCDPE